MTLTGIEVVPHTNDGTRQTGGKVGTDKGVTARIGRTPNDRAVAIALESPEISVNERAVVGSEAVVNTETVAQPRAPAGLVRMAIPEVPAGMVETISGRSIRNTSLASEVEVRTGMPRVSADAVGVDLTRNGTVVGTNRGMVIAAAVKAVVKRTGIEAVGEIDRIGTVGTLLVVNVAPVAQKGTANNARNGTITRTFVGSNSLKEPQMDGTRTGMSEGPLRALEGPGRLTHDGCMR